MDFSTTMSGHFRQKFDVASSFSSSTTSASSSSSFAIWVGLFI